MRVRTLVCAGEETEAWRSSQVVSGDVPGPNLDSPGAQPCPPLPSALAGGLTWCTAMPSAALCACWGADLVPSHALRRPLRLLGDWSSHQLEVFTA